MFDPIFDFNDNDFIFQTSDSSGIDSEGHMHIRMCDSMSMDMETGELHLTSSWKDDEEDGISE